MFPGLLNSLADTSQDFQAGADRFIPSLLDAPQTILAKMAQWEAGSASPGLGYQAARGVATPGTVRATGWHGSPHKFTKPDISKVGTGEGAQAYGHGFYAAERERTGDMYRKNVKNASEINRINARLSELSKEMSLYEPPGGGYRQYTDPRGHELSREYDRLIDEREAVVSSPGYLYKMDIPDADIEKMLDWDAPLSEQGEGVRGLLFENMSEERAKGIVDNVSDLAEKALKESVTDGKPRPFTDAWEIAYRDPELALAEARLSDFRGSGATFYNRLDPTGASKEASDYLNSIGIPGIKYWDQGSRGAGEGTRNFVIFDPDRIKMLERNEQPIEGLL